MWPSLLSSLSRLAAASNKIRVWRTIDRRLKERELGENSVKFTFFILELLDHKLDFAHGPVHDSVELRRAW